MGCRTVDLVSERVSDQTSSFHPTHFRSFWRR